MKDRVFFFGSLERIRGDPPIELSCSRPASLKSCKPASRRLTAKPDFERGVLSKSMRWRGDTASLNK